MLQALTSVGGAAKPELPGDEAVRPPGRGGPEPGPKMAVFDQLGRIDAIQDPPRKGIDGRADAFDRKVERLTIQGRDGVGEDRPAVVVLDELGRLPGRRVDEILSESGRKKVSKRDRSSEANWRFVWVSLGYEWSISGRPRSLTMCSTIPRELRSVSTFVSRFR